VLTTTSPSSGVATKASGDAWRSSRSKSSSPGAAAKPHPDASPPSKTRWSTPHRTPWPP